MGLDLGIRHRRRGAENDITVGVAITREQEIQPDRCVREGPRLEFLGKGALRGRYYAGHRDRKHRKSVDESLFHGCFFQLDEA